MIGGRAGPEWRADMLKQVGLVSRRHYRDGERGRGYLVADIERASSRYLTGRVGHPLDEIGEGV